MPTAAPKPCSHCGVLVRDGSARCAQHKQVGRFGDARRGTRQQRGYGAAWEALRKQVLSRDKGLCQVCLSEGRFRPAREVDHKVPKAQGGTDAFENLQSICTTCHKAKTALEAQVGAGRGRGESNLCSPTTQDRTLSQIFSCGGFEGGGVSVVEGEG